MAREGQLMATLFHLQVTWLWEWSSSGYETYRKQSLSGETYRDKLQVLTAQTFGVHSADRACVQGPGHIFPHSTYEITGQQHNKQPLPGSNSRRQVTYWYFGYNYILGNMVATLQTTPIDVKSVPKHTLLAVDSSTSIGWKKIRDLEFEAWGQILAHFLPAGWLWVSNFTFLIVFSSICKTKLLEFWTS